MSDNKGKAKSQNLPRRARKSRNPSPRKARKSSVAMPGRTRSRVAANPVAMGSVRQDPTSFKEGPITHRIGGRGQRFIGSQMLINVTTTASDSQMWTGTAPAATYSINQILLSPDNLNGRLAVYANIYARYVFRSVTLEYEPLVATSQAGGGVLAIVQDPEVAAFGTILTYALAQDVSPSVTFPFRDRAKLTYSYTGDDLYFTENDTASSASRRQTNQAVIIGVPSASSLGAVTMGTIRIHYVIDMFQPIPTLAISAEERKLVSDFLEKYRAEKKKADEQKLAPVALARTGTLIASQSASGCFSQVAGSVGSRIDERYVLVRDGESKVSH